MLLKHKNTTEILPEFGIATGASGMARNMGISGDNYICRRLPHGKYIVALSDGMGSGSEASKCSKFVLDSIHQLLRIGLPPDTILRTVNSAVPMNSTEEYFSTVDMAIFDLRYGTCDLYKAGAAPTIIHRFSESGVLRLPALPVGIISPVDYRSVSFKIEHGDRIFFLTDGVSESIPPDSELTWARNIILEHPLEKPRSVAERLIWGATLRYGRNERDDMTVVGVEII